MSHFNHRSVDLRSEPNQSVPKRATPSQKLIAKLIAAGFDIPAGVRFERLRPGHWQRSAGAWLWRLHLYDPPQHWYELGCCQTVSECLAADELVPYQDEVIAEFTREHLEQRMQKAEEAKQRRIERERTRRKRYRRSRHENGPCNMPGCWCGGAARDET